jgi:hypothetical protein
MLYEYSQWTEMRLMKSVITCGTSALNMFFFNFLLFSGGGFGTLFSFFDGLIELSAASSPSTVLAGARFLLAAEVDCDLATEMLSLLGV